MVPVANTPILEYLIETLAAAGIERVVMVVGYERERIQTHFGDGADWGLSITYVTQSERLGTGHALLQARAEVPEEFLVVNGDRIIAPSAIEAVMATRERTPAGAVAMTRVSTPRRYGVVRATDGQLRAIEDQPQAASVPDHINAGVYRLRDRIFPVLEAQQPGPTGELSLPAALTTLADRTPIGVARYTGPWRDLSQLWDLPRMTAALLDARGGQRAGQAHATAVVAEATALAPGAQVGPNSTLRAGTSLGANVTVGANVVLDRAVVFPDATINDGAVITDAVVGAGATVGTNAAVPGGTADLVVDGTVYEQVAFGGAIGDHARVGSGVVCRPGTRVGDGATIAAGATVSGRIPANALQSC